MFLTGLKMLNVVFASNSKCDILLLCKVNLELAKLLEDSYQYRIAIENIRVCLENIDKFRSEYLKRGVEGKYDKLLPFSLTSSNIRLGQALSQIKEKYLNQKKTTAQILRIRKRRENGEKKLTQK